MLPTAKSRLWVQNIHHFDFCTLCVKIFWDEFLNLRTQVSLANPTQ